MMREGDIMPNIENLIRTMVEPIIQYPEEFKINIQDSEEFKEFHIELHPEDVGRVIGRKGRVIRAIRTIVYSIRNRNEKRPRIVIDDNVED